MKEPKSTRDVVRERGGRAASGRSGPGAAVLLTTLLLAVAGPVNAEPHVVEDVEVTVLSTNLAEVHGRGEWGWSALVEADSRCVLFDTGNHPDNVLANAAALGVDLSCVTDVVLSHHHADHTGGVLTLHEAISAAGPGRFARVHVAQGIFLPRPRPAGEEGNVMIARRAPLEAAGVEFVIHDGPAEILPGIWVTGPIERVHPEKNYPASMNVLTDAGLVVDFIPESQGLAVRTGEGFAVVLGCGHAGVLNTLSQVRRDIEPAPIAAVMGGFHLFAADDQTLDWVGRELAKIAPRHVMGAHCTGIEPLYRLRAGAGLDREHAIVGSVGSRWRTGSGFEPGPLAR